jgi:hypothetical protein
MKVSVLSCRVSSCRVASGLVLACLVLFIPVFYRIIVLSFCPRPLPPLNPNPNLTPPTHTHTSCGRTHEGNISKVKSSWHASETSVGHKYEFRETGGENWMDPSRPGYFQQEYHSAALEQFHGDISFHCPCINHLVV